MSKDNREELKPCPFCGDKVRYRKSDGEGVCKTTHYINCDNCGLEMFDITEKGIIDNWNWRNGEVTTDSGADVCEWSYEFSTHEYIVDCYGAISECDIDFNLIKTFKVCPYCTKPITIKGK